MRRIHLLAVLLAWVLSSTITHAAAPGKTKGLAVRFLAQSAPADLGPVVLAANDVRTAEFDLPLNNLSIPQTPPARVFSLWAVKKNISLATITLPEEGDSFIALLITSPKGGYTPVVMRYDDPKFRPGDIYFHNLADKTVVGFVGTAKFQLPAGGGTILTPKGARNEKFYDVGLGVRETDGDRVLATTRWPEDNQVRNYVFFFVDPGTNRIAFRAVDEFVPPPAKDG